MEERIKGEISNAIIIVCITVVASAMLTMILTTNETNRVLDRIEQLEAQMDRIERTNKQ